MKCAWAKCFNEATAGLCLNVPAQGCPIKEHDPVRLVFSVALCDTCFAAAKAADFIIEDPARPGFFPVKEIVRIQTKGMAPPDFDRAFLTKVSFNSEEWIVLNRPRPPGWTRPQG